MFSMLFVYTVLLVICVRFHTSVPECHVYGDFAGQETRGFSPRIKDG